jgi:hypothetical protein
VLDKKKSDKKDKSPLKNKFKEKVVIIEEAPIVSQEKSKISSLCDSWKNKNPFVYLSISFEIVLNLIEGFFLGLILSNEIHNTNQVISFILIVQYIIRKIPEEIEHPGLLIMYKFTAA